MHSLRVLHVHKHDSASSFSGAFAEVPGALFVNTCLRKLWIFSGAVTDAHPHFKGEIFSGIEAYSFLLRVSTGLESEIAGETDIFGQIKDAWKLYCAPDGATKIGLSSNQKEVLSPWMQRLFEDTKEIRSRYIQNLGGTSYGSLVRKLLRERVQATGRTKPVLLVGAGAFAESIAPWLIAKDFGQELWIVNRTREKAEKLAVSMSEHNVRVLSSDEEENAWKTAAHIVICIPFDAKADAKRIAWFKSGDANRSVIHLGGISVESGQWKEIEGFKNLDHVFEMQKQLNELRKLGLERARHACLERARLRALDGTLSTPHGWEDLAALSM